MAEKGTTVARAYVQITPSLQGAGKTIEKELGDETKVSGARVGSKLGENIGNGLKTAGKVIGAGLAAAFTAASAVVAAAGAGIVAVTKQSIESFAEYEQLAGGVEKIFDTMDTSKILEDASNAYKNLNMSANQYLNAINSVGAAFSATMGDQKAYETAKKGMQAIADFASGTGKNVEELNQKYQMITRSTSSYQSIADQFSGILPATSADFLKQAQAAGLLSKKYKSLTEVPIAKYQQAVTEMLAKGTEQLGLTGNTAKEAFGTISGSIAATKSAWSNFTTALAGGGDLSKASTSLINSAVAVGKNILPVIKDVLKNIGAAIPELLNMVQEALPDILPIVTDTILAVGNILANSSTINMILTSIDYIVNSIIQSLTQGGTLSYLLDGVLRLVVQIASGLLTALPDILNTVITAISTILPMLIPVITNLIPQIVNSISTMLPLIIQSGIDILLSLINGISEMLPQLIAMIPTLISTLVNLVTENLPAIIDTGITLILSLVDGIMAALPDLLEKMPEIIAKLTAALVANLPALIDGGVKLTTSLVTGLIKAVPILITQIPNIFKQLVAELQNNLPRIIEGGIKIVMSLIDGIKQRIGAAGEAVGSLVARIMNIFGELPRKVVSVGKDLITGLWQGVNDKMSWLTDKIKSFTSGVTDKLKKFFKIGSPSKLMADEVGRWIGEGVGVGFVKSMDSVADDMEASMSFTTQLARSGAPSGDLGTVAETNNFGAPVINVYGAPGQDINALANIIMQKIQTATERKAAAYA